MNQKRENTIIHIIGVMIFILFLGITYVTPLAGDDWGYAVTGRESNALLQAFQFYFTWSGRFFSELWGFVVAPHRWLYVILNPIIWISIYYGIVRLFKNNRIMIALVVFFLMVSVPHQLRMETYTWIMGTTYVIPLLWMILILGAYKNYLFDFKKIAFIIYFLNFYVALSMENAAAILVVLNALVLVYCWYYKRHTMQPIIACFVISVVGLILLRISPGASFRLLRDNPEWITLSIVDKVSINYLNFLTHTFIENGILVSVLALFLGIYNYQNKRKHLAFMDAIVVLVALAPIVYGRYPSDLLLNLFDIAHNETAVWVVSMTYLVFIVTIFLSIDKHQMEGVTYLLLAGGANIVMMISPIFGSRSSLYTYYFIVILIAFVIDKMKITKWFYALPFACLIMFQMAKYYRIYQSVYLNNQIRESEIAYYKDHPEIEEAWFVRMPVNSIHSADIEEWDTYHQIVFKKYFSLSENVKLFFYWREYE